jgi:glycosyltransferase involved in cell wall biosynthesis
LRAAAGFVRSVLYFPDETVGWVPFGLEQAVELHLKERYDVVYTTSPQRVTHVFGLFLKRWFNLPWVAEFRDPWPLPNRPLRRELEWRLQTSILRHADAVVPVASRHAESLCADYHLPAEKVNVITNGFDEEDFALDGRPSDLFDPQYVNFSHFGTVYPNLSGKFFEALLELVREDPELSSRLRVNIVGFPDGQVQHYAQQPELREVLRLCRFLEHGEAIRAMLTSHALLLFLGDPATSRLVVAGKLYEYLRSGKPILAVATEGGTKELLERTHAGQVVHPEDVPGMKRALRQLLVQCLNWPARDPATDRYLAGFNHEHLAGEMARVLDGVAAHDS